MKLKAIFHGVLLSLCALFFAAPVVAQEAGTLSRVSGKATVTTTENATREAKVNEPVSVGDIVTTEAGAEVLIRFKDSSTMIVRSASKLKISQFRFEKKIHRHFTDQSLVGDLACCQWPDCQGSAL